METIRDCKGRICCVGDPVTGYVENKYKGQEATAYLAVGMSLTITRENILTRITRTGQNTFDVERRNLAA